MSYNENFTMYSVRTEPFDFCWGVGRKEGGAGVLVKQITVLNVQRSPIPTQKSNGGVLISLIDLQHVRL